jgi:hypothetical protein
VPGIDKFERKHLIVAIVMSMVNTYKPITKLTKEMEESNDAPDPANINQLFDDLVLKIQVSPRVHFNNAIDFILNRHFEQFSEVTSIICLLTDL